MSARALTDRWSEKNGHASPRRGRVRDGTSGTGKTNFVALASPRAAAAAAVSLLLPDGFVWLMHKGRVYIQTCT